MVALTNFKYPKSQSQSFTRGLLSLTLTDEWMIKLIPQ
jgi:hypothetical protein